MSGDGHTNETRELKLTKQGPRDGRTSGGVTDYLGVDMKKPTNHLDPKDVPCGSCQEGYGGPHNCDSIGGYCPCDQAQNHTADDAEVSR